MGAGFVWVVLLVGAYSCGTPDSSDKKQQFERSKGSVHSEYESEGTPVRAIRPGSMVGEPVDGETKRALLDDIRSTDGAKASAAVNALMLDKSPEKLEALLVGLERGHIAVPMALVPYLDDPRVRPALVRAVAKAPPDNVSNFAQVMGMVGGDGAMEALRARLKELLADPRTAKDDDFHNFTAGSLTSTARAMLRLDPDATDAARALTQLMDHPNAFNRRDAVHAAVDVSEGYMHTEAIELLRTKLATLIDSDDDQLFLAAFPVLITVDHKTVLARAKALLEHEDALTRDIAAGRLWDSASPAARSLAGQTYLRWLEAEPPTDRALQYMTRVGPFVSRLVVEGVVRRGLAEKAASLRLETVALLRYLPNEEAQRIAVEALSNEPDPAIQKQIRQYTDQRTTGVDTE